MTFQMNKFNMRIALQIERFPGLYVGSPNAPESLGEFNSEFDAIKAVIQYYLNCGVAIKDICLEVDGPNFRQYADRDYNFSIITMKIENA